MLKNSLVLFLEPHSGLKPPVFAVFWPWFLGVLVLFWTIDRSNHDFFNSLLCFNHEEFCDEL